MEQINEEWRPVVGYEGLYEVSNLGRVKRLDGYDSARHRWKGGIFSPIPRKDGYINVCLRKEGKYKTFLVHRLVAQAFIPNPEGLPVINHKNEDKTLNVVFLKDDGSVDECQSNLEWCTYKYNTNYGTGIERAKKNRVQTRIRRERYHRLRKKQSSEESLW